MLRRRRKPDALQGTLDLLVLKTLSRGPQHGYGIAAHVESISGDILRVEEGSLYPALHRMEHLGWIAADWQTTANNRRARIYKLTRAGLKRLDEEELRWERLTKGVGKVLRFA
ncbi:MAG: PadR family transcriptional regulator [Acidobacteria bacterium]|nr:MAG: PadR family transcriptional regulator [Acidobacteriota bacterium]